MAQLHQKPAVMLVDAFADFPPERNIGVPVNGGVVGNDASLYRDGYEGGNNGSNAAAGKFQLPVDAGRVAGTVVIVESAGYVGTENSVLDAQVAKLYPQPIYSFNTPFSGFFRSK
jgi:hypothetical protein